TRVRIAEKGGEPLAASLEVSYGDTRTYLYGASSSAKRNLMAPYALHWDAIRTAKREGCRYYDFHGVNPADESSPSWKSSWAGITRFKLGWGGERRDLVGTWERPTNRVAYRLFRMISH
ncbi:MAG TPA: peptidoglycan bridge formation glycyltransferase FemA/FemB family protein, partial [Candidatus Methylomirabilis sp.]|nr:peptidoglycan bridge formation glycyltransferase FemA/FemB family protein [Candidatus Methylomirabilis sp.]